MLATKTHYPKQQSIAQDGRQDQPAEFAQAAISPGLNQMPPGVARRFAAFDLQPGFAADELVVSQIPPSVIFACAEFVLVQQVAEFGYFLLHSLSINSKKIIFLTSVSVSHLDLPPST